MGKPTFSKKGLITLIHHSALSINPQGKIYHSEPIHCLIHCVCGYVYTPTLLLYSSLATNNREKEREREGGGEGGRGWRDRVKEGERDDRRRKREGAL